ncbi:MAG TPA: hypothetical protein VGD72_09715 [Mycobacteriales bacterium]|jgi:hypothetical protein
MNDGYPVAAVRADGDDVSAWLARRGIPAEVVAGPDGWVGVDGLTPEDTEALAELASALGTTVVVIDADGDQLVVDVLGTDPALGSAPDDAHALAAATGRPETAGRVAEILGDSTAGLRARHRRLAALLGLPDALPPGGSARARATGAPLEPAGAAGPGREAQPTPTSLGLPAWLPAIVLWTGVVVMLVAVVLAIASVDRRGLLVAGMAGLAGCACVVLGLAGRSMRR